MCNSSFRSDSNRAASALSSLFALARDHSQSGSQQHKPHREAGTKPVLLSPDPGTSFLPPSNSNVALDFANISTVAQLYTPCQELFSSFSFIFIIASSCCAARSLSFAAVAESVSCFAIYKYALLLFFFVLERRESSDTTTRWKIRMLAVERLKEPRT